MTPSFFAEALASTSRSEQRSTTLGVLDELDFHENSALQSKLLPLVTSYRSSSTSQPLPSKSMTIADGPFLGFVLQNKIADLYAAAYESNYAEQYDKFVVHPSLEFIFDQFLDAYADGSLPPEMRQAAASLGPCLANKARRGKSEACPLDENETHLTKPSTVSLAGAKFGCHLGIPNACRTRQLIFNEAKEDLVKARKERALAGPFNAIFPQRFRKEFLKDLSSKRATLPTLVSRKFGGETSTLWDANAELAESDDESRPSHLSMKGFAQGLQADLRVSEHLAHSADARERGMASALFYAAANRILMLTGGTRAVWNGESFALDPRDSFDAKEPKRVPVLASENYGGWSVASSKDGVAGFKIWDWSEYDPSRTLSPTPLQLFPTVLTLGERGIPQFEASAAVERIEDMAELLSALTEFLRATRQGAELSDHFGTAADFAKLLDPDSPMIFPMEGRLLAYGALAGVLKNFVAPVGHLEKSQAGTPQGGLGLVFHDHVKIGSRDGTGASVWGVAKLLNAASRLKSALLGDPAVPPELLAQIPELDSALQVGAFSLGAQGQNQDGGFMENLVLPQAPAIAPGARKLMTTVETLRALTRGYEASHILLIRLSIKAAWKYLDPFWSGDSAVPSALLTSAELWTLLQLWNETQKAVRPDVSSEVDWATWDRRMTALRARLMSELG